MLRMLNLMEHWRVDDVGDLASEVPELSCGETTSSDDNSAPSIFTVDSDHDTAKPPDEGVCAPTELNVPARYSRIHPDHQTPLDEKARPLLSNEDQRWLDYARAFRRRNRRFALFCEDIVLSEWDNDEFDNRLRMMQEGRLGGEEAEDDYDDGDDDNEGIFYLVPADKAPFPPYRLAMPLEVTPGHDACDATGTFLCQPTDMCPDTRRKADAVAHGRRFGFFDPWQAMLPGPSAQETQAVGHGRPGEGDGCGTSPHPPNSEESAGSKPLNPSEKRAGCHAHLGQDEWTMIDGIWVRSREHTGSEELSDHAQISTGLSDTPVKPLAKPGGRMAFRLQIDACLKSAFDNVVPDAGLTVEKKRMVSISGAQQGPGKRYKEAQQI